MAASAILQTKSHTPKLRSSLVSRPRLIERLTAGMDGRLILISAPAGYGKTTLVTEWLQTTQAKCAWLSLDESDNDPRRFLGYLLAALHQAQPEIGQSVEAMLHSPEPPPLEVLIASVLEAWNTLSNDTILALDDYHVITNIVIHDTLNDRLTYLPPLVHLVILTRADPPLPLARLRVLNQLTEIRLRKSEVKWTIRRSKWLRRIIEIASYTSRHGQ